MTFEFTSEIRISDLNDYHNYVSFQDFHLPGRLSTEFYSSICTDLLALKLSRDPILVARVARSRSRGSGTREGGLKNTSRLREKDRSI